MASKKNRERLLLFVTLGIVGLFAGDRLVVKPLIAGWRDRADQIAKLDVKLDNGHRLITHKNQYFDNWREMQERSLPADGAMAQSQMQAAVNTWSHTSALGVSDVKSRWLNEEDTGRQLEIRLSANGTLPQIMRFLYELERDPMAVQLIDYTIRTRDDRGTELSLDTRFTGVVLKEDKKS